MYGYDQIIDLNAIQNLQMHIEHWLLTRVLVWPTLVQLIAIVAGTGMTFVISKLISSQLAGITKQLRMTDRTGRFLLGIAKSLVFPLVTLGVLLLLRLAAQSLSWPVILLTLVINLVFVWVVIRLAASVIRNETWSRVAALTAFALATLDILDLLQPLLVFLDQIGVRVGGTHLSVLEIIKGTASVTIFLWLAVMTSRILEQRVHRAKSLTPSLKLLTGKLLKATLIAAALMFALNSIGIDLTAFAVFSGAVGVGVGFGLQRPIANLISGVILLLDRSIKPGDVVELAGGPGPGGHTFGWVTSLNARYASLTTRDGTEWLIPNEDLITQRVVNWSFSNNHLRLPTPFGISYDSDVRLAIRLAVEAAKENPRILKDPPPVCRLMGFGDSSVDLELRIWISDPVNGVVNVRSEVLLAMWDKFRENGIRIPFAQRDLHIKDDSRLRVTLSRAGETAA